MKRKNKPKQQVEFKKNSNSAILKIFGENLKRIREKEDLSQEAMAFIAGLSRSYYVEVEAGKRNISLINIIKIITALNVELSKTITLQEIEKYIIK